MLLQVVWFFDLEQNFEVVTKDGWHCLALRKANYEDKMLQRTVLLCWLWSGKQIGAVLPSLSMITKRRYHCGVTWLTV